MQIDTGTHRKESLHNVVFVHVQAKESNPMLLARCHMQCHAQGETHLAHRRRGCDDDQVCTLPSSDEGIEILHTRRNASHLAPLAWGATPGSDTGGSSCSLDGSFPSVWSSPSSSTASIRTRDDVKQEAGNHLHICMLHRALLKNEHNDCSQDSLLSQQITPTR